MRLPARLAAIALIGGVLAVLAPSPAAAHTGLDTSTPADGAAVDGPLDVVVLEFTGTPTAIDDGVAVADAAGTSFTPVEVIQDGLRITARFDPPLDAGSYALSWIVRSDDTHTIDGSFAFVVNAPATTTTLSPTTTATPTTEDAAAPVDAATPTTPTTSVAPSTTVVAGAVDAPAAAPPPPPAVTSEIDDGESVANIGRLLLFPTAVVAIGALAFSAFSFAGRREELGSLLRIVRWLGVGVALGAVLEVAGLRTVFGGMGDLLDSAAGRAAVTRVLAGVLLVVGLGAVGGSARSLSAAVIDEPITADGASSTPPGRWRPGRRDAGGLVGVVLLAVSFAFDGHSVSEGPRLVHALGGVAHVVAASIWAGGLVALATVLWLRHRGGAKPRALEMVARFSVMAMFSLAVAGLAGVVMAWFIQDDLGSYLTTEWGRLMLVKLGLVALAVALGAYNHFRVLPALEAGPDDQAVLQRTRAVVTTEATLLVAAALVTAILVGASTI